MFFIIILRLKGLPSNNMSTPNLKWNVPLLFCCWKLEVESHLQKVNFLPFILILGLSTFLHFGLICSHLSILINMSKMAKDQNQSFYNYKSANILTLKKTIQLPYSCLAMLWCWWLFFGIQYSKSIRIEHCLITIVITKHYKTIITTLVKIWFNFLCT
jgi:hypothetical protein